MELDDDSKNESNGTITATVLADSNPTPTYILASTDTSADVTVKDNDSEVPVLSILSDAAGVDGTGVTEGFSFKFKVRSDRIISGSALPIDVSADDGAASLGLTIVGTKQIPIGSQEVEFTVTMGSSADVAPSSNVNIVITLAEHDDYDTDPSEETISIKVKDNDTPSASNPTISISAPHYVAEGSTFDLILTPSQTPSSGITVNIDVNSTQGNFLAPILSSTATIVAGSNEGRFSVTTTTEAAQDSDGRITGEILEGKGYALSADSAPRNAEIVVLDALPVISLSAPDSVDEDDGKFDITLISNITPIANHPITITTLEVDDSTGQSHDYFDSIPTTPIVIDHNSSNRTITIPVTLVDNGDYNGWGEITATLTNGLDYTADPNANTKSVEIVDDEPAPHSVSISAPVSVVEGDNILVKLQASPALNAGESLSVDLKATNVTGTYLNYTSTPITITDANSSSTTLSIPTSDDTTRNVNGEIKLTIVRGDGYELGSSAIKNVTILDKALLPAVTIAAVDAGPIDEGETAVFNLSATPNPTAEIMVSVQVDHAQGTTGNFLDSDDIKIHQVRVSTTGTGELRIDTVSDSDPEDSGSIVATLKDDPKGEDDADNINRTTSSTYLVGSNNTSASVSVADNDTVGLPSITISGAESIDEGGTATFTLTADPINTTPILVRVRITHNGNFFSRDLTSTNEFDFSIPANGTTPGQITIDEDTVTDGEEESNGSITLLVLSDPESTDTYNVGEISSHTTVVKDDDDSSLPNITISGGSDVVEGANAVFTLTATQAGSANSVSVRVQVSENGNFLSGDAGVFPVSVNVGTTTPYNVSTEEDVYDEDDGLITATILKDDAQTARYGIGASTSATVQVSDNDDPPTISITVDPLTEGNDTTTNEAMVFTVTTNQESHKEISVDYATTSTGSATSDTDFSTDPGDFLATSGTLTFTKRTISDSGVVTAGITSQTFSVPIYGDALDEDNETIIVNLSGVRNAEIATGETTETGTITDDDPLPAVSIADGNGLEGTSSDETVSFEVTLAPVSGREVTVIATTSRGASDSATAGIDYTVKSETLTFAKGETSKTFTVDTKKDDLPEPDETFTVTLSSVNNATISTPTATGTIQSDEIPAFEVSNGVATEGDSGNVAMTFTVTLSSGATQPESVNYTTDEGTAKEDSDFIAPTSDNTLTFELGQQSKTFTIDIVGNDYFELEETFTVQLSGNSAQTALYNGGRATGTIEDNDAFRESTISVTATSATVDQSNNEDVQFTFSAVPELARELPITITLAETEDFLAVDPSTQTRITLPANTSATNTYIESYATKTANGDFEADSTVTLTISDVAGYAVDSLANSTSVVIHDADTPSGISVLAISESVTEGSGEAAVFLIKSDQFSTSARKINVNIDDGVANFISDPGNSIKTIPANSRSLLLPVTIVSDSDFEANGEITVSILVSDSNSDTYTVAGGTNNKAKVPIFDNDAPNVSGDVNAGISIIQIEDSVDESEVARFQVTAKSTTNTNRIIRVEVDDGTDHFIDEDNQQSQFSYDKVTKIFSVTILANQHNAILNVVLDDDSKNETNGTLTARVLADSNPTPTYVLASTHTSARVTIEDNDEDVPILSLSSDAAGEIGTGVTERFSFKFKVRSDRIISNSALPIEVSADDGTAALGLTIVGTKQIPIGSQEVEFTVTMGSGADVAPASNVNIAVSLAEHLAYDTNPAEELISIKVKDNDTPSASNPTVSITGPHYVAEGSTFNYTLTASHILNSEITVNVDVQSTKGSFLAVNQGGVRTADIASGSKTGTLTVGTVVEAAIDSDGRINAEVVEGKGYALSATEAPRNAEIVVLDALPVISLSAPDSVDEDDGKFDITLTSNIVPVENHPITITSLVVDDSTGQGFDYFDSIPTTPIVIDHNSSNRTITVPVTLVTNNIYNGWGEITATLTNGLDYTADPNANTKSVEIVDDDTAPHSVSINTPVSVVEGDDILVKLQASPALTAGESLSVDLQATNVTGTYLNYTSAPIIITDANSSSTTLSIPTRDDTTRNVNGEIKLTIVRGDGYELGTNCSQECDDFRQS